MEDSLEQELKDMARRAAQLELLDFAIGFPDEATERMAYAIEYGHRVDNTIVPPKPFMRATKEAHESEWNELLEKLGADFVEGGHGLTIDDIGMEVAGRMEDDYKDSALTYGVPSDIYSGLTVTW